MPFTLQPCPIHSLGMVFVHCSCFRCYQISTIVHSFNIIMFIHGMFDQTWNGLQALDKINMNPKYMKNVYVSDVITKNDVSNSIWAIYFVGHSLHILVVLLDCYELFLAMFHKYLIQIEFTFSQKKREKKFENSQ